MALVRCPSCGRVADGKSCFACGYDWPAGGAAAAPAPEPHKPPQSQSFKIGSPSSFPTAAAVPAAPAEEVNLDVEIEAEPPPPPSAPAPPPAFPTTPFGAPPPAFSSPAPAPAFPSTPAGAAPAFAGFGGGGLAQPPPAFGAPPAFPGFPPAAFPSPSGNWGTPATPQQQVTKPPQLSQPPPAFPSPSGSWGAPPAPVPTPSFPSPSGNWGPPPGAFPSLPPLGDTVPPPSAPAAPQYQTPAVPQSPPPKASAKPSAALNGLFDGLGGDAPAGAPAPIDDGLDVSVTEERSALANTLEEAPADSGSSDAGANVVRDSAQDAGDFFNFTLEPGSTVEPAADPSPFDGDGGAAPAVHEAPPDFNSETDFSGAAASSSNNDIAGLDVSFDIPADMPDVPPPVATAPPQGSTPGFAELDDFGLDAVTGTPAPAPTPESTGDPLAGLSLDDIPADDLSVPSVDVSMESSVDLAADIELGGDLAVDSMGNDLAPPPAPPAEDDFSLAGLEAMDDPAPRTQTPPPQMAPSSSSGPTLSTRVGKLAESLEDAGRIADAALLYEVQAVLSASGR